MRTKVLLGAFCSSVLASCSSVDVKGYKNETPALVLENYLNGTLEAHGFFQDRFGKIVKRFKVFMKATWTGNSGILNEEFIYSDGTRSKRVWKLTKTGAGKYVGQAEDVVGDAAGESAGNAFRWKYTLNLPVGSSTYQVQFDDWMYLMDEKVMLNKSKMSKLGVYLGEVTLVFIKQ